MLYIEFTLFFIFILNKKSLFQFNVLFCSVLFNSIQFYSTLLWPGIIKATLPQFWIRCDCAQMTIDQTISVSLWRKAYTRLLLLLRMILIQKKITQQKKSCIAKNNELRQSSDHLWYSNAKKSVSCCFTSVKITCGYRSVLTIENCVLSLIEEKITSIWNQYFSNIACNSFDNVRLL